MPSPTSDCRFVILVSGRGSNMLALIESVAARRLPAQVCAVISNVADAPALAAARSRGVATQVLPHGNFRSREDFDSALAAAIDEHQPDYILLAGFMRVLTSSFVTRYAGRLVNIHPSLLPAFPGLQTHRQALAAGVRWHGCTVHFVTPVLDHGPVLAQAVLPVNDDDTPETLAERVLRMEHRLYPEVAAWLAEGRVTLDEQGRVRVSGTNTRAFLGGPHSPSEILA